MPFPNPPLKFRLSTLIKTVENLVGAVNRLQSLSLYFARSVQIYDPVTKRKSTIACNIYTSKRLFIYDPVTKRTYLIVTGADTSVIPPPRRNMKEDGRQLYAANGTQIKTFGTENLTLSLGLRREFRFV